MADEAKRAWCAVVRFPGKESLYLGTVMVRERAPQHEVEAEVWALIDRVFPTRPVIERLVPGMIVFIPEGE